MFWMEHDPQTKKGALPRNVNLRRGSLEDELAAFEVMRKTMGHEMVWMHHVAARRHLLDSDDTHFWVAEERQRFGNPRLIGYARSVVRDRVWSLTEFFVLPGHHRQGIGGALLAHCREDGEQRGADTRFVLASQHPGADSLYIRKLECTPRLPMMLLVGALSRLRAPDPAAPPIVETALPYSLPAFSRQRGFHTGTSLRAEPMILTEAVQEELDRLDRDIVGYARPQEHRFWCREMGGNGGASRIFRRVHRTETADEVGEIAGYAYLGAHSSGPALAAEPVELPQMIAHTAGLLRAIGSADSDFEFTQPLEQYMAVPGINETVLRWLLECGWQIVFHYLFMSSRPLGRLDRYVGHNPLYFL